MAKKGWLGGTLSGIGKGIEGYLTDQMAIAEENRKKQEALDVLAAKREQEAAIRQEEYGQKSLMGFLEKGYLPAKRTMPAEIQPVEDMQMRPPELFAGMGRDLSLGVNREMPAPPEKFGSQKATPDFIESPYPIPGVEGFVPTGKTPTSIALEEMRQKNRLSLENVKYEHQKGIAGIKTKDEFQKVLTGIRADLSDPLKLMNMESTSKNIIGSILNAKSDKEIDNIVGVNQSSLLTSGDYSYARTIAEQMKRFKVYGETEKKAEEAKAEAVPKAEIEKQTEAQAKTLKVSDWPAFVKKYGTKEKAILEAKKQGIKLIK